MIQFFLRRSLKAISMRRKWLLAVFIPVMIYLGVSAATPNRFVVSQEIAITGNTLISLSPRAADLRSLQELISTPSLFFLNRFALALLTKRLELRMPSIQNWRPEVSIISKVEQCLTLDMTGKNTVRITYEGNNRKEGETMVAFYARRLVKQTEDYLTLNRTAVKNGASVPRIIGRTTVSEIRLLWCNSRLVPALFIGVVTLFVLMVLITLLEWFKPSFNSERHVADYLKVPILGTFPDVKRLKRGG
jgi:protein tyrosine kinase modulator